MHSAKKEKAIDIPASCDSPNKILVGLSGGVDSAVCVRLLQEQGFAVYGLVISFSSASDGAVQSAKTSANELGIPLRVCSCEASFEKEVVVPFCSEYVNGKTPNPCILCNPAVKFKALIDAANDMGINYIATGHYARTVEHDGRWYLQRAACPERDQSYMLYRLSQAVLSRLCLPVGEFEKDDIRSIAKENKLSSANAPDSQEICFIPSGNYSQFILDRGITSKKGSFISPAGANIGPHKGVLHYTVGQRRGLGIALGKPVFVKSISEEGDIYLGWSGEEFSSRVDLSGVVSTSGKEFDLSKEYFVKIRSAAKLVPCTVAKLENEGICLTFSKPQRAPAPGQSAVLYINNLVVGGGFISSAYN